MLYENFLYNSLLIIGSGALIIIVVVGIIYIIYSAVTYKPSLPSRISHGKYIHKGTPEMPITVILTPTSNANETQYNIWVRDPNNPSIVSIEAETKGGDLDVLKEFNIQALNANQTITYVDNNTISITISDANYTTGNPWKLERVPSKWDPAPEVVAAAAPPQPVPPPPPTETTPTSETTGFTGDAYLY